LFRLQEGNGTDGTLGTCGTEEDGGAGGGGGVKIFSNHWKTGEKFFQSLENSGHFSNHWKKIFQSLENSPFAGELADCAPPGK
jgi:hypothetical protein